MANVPEKEERLTYRDKGKKKKKYNHVDTK